MIYVGVKFLFVKNAVLDYVHEKGLNCSESVWRGEKLNNKIKELLDFAIERAKENNRKTVLDRDL